MACRTSGASGVVAEWSRYTIGINSIGASGRRGLLAQWTPADKLLDWPVEGLHVLVDVEHLVASDRPFLGCLGQTVWMLRFLEQEHRDEADAAVGAGDLNRAVAISLVEQLDLAISERLGAGEAFVVSGPLLDQSDQVHWFHYSGRSSGGQAADSGSPAESVDPDVRAGTDPAAVAGERDIVGIDGVEDARGAAVRRRKARQRWSLRLQRPL